MQHPYPNSNLPVNYTNPPPYPVNPSPPIIAVHPNQMNNATDTIVTNIMENQKKLEKDKEIARLKEENQKLQMAKLETQIENLKDINRTNTNLLIANQGKAEPITIINNNNNNNNNNIVATTTTGGRGRLHYSDGMYCLFLVLNIFFPGVGTIVAAAMYGKTSDIGDRTTEIICHGVTQLLLWITIFGWIWAILEATRYFEAGVCCC